MSEAGFLSVPALDVSMLGNAEKLFFELCRKQRALWGWDTRGGSLLIITAERAAKTALLHSHYEEYNAIL